MSSVEAAASLFGSSDSGSDLDFLTAPEGTNSSSDSPTSAGPRLGAGVGNELFAEQDSSGLFDVKEDAAPTSPLFGAQGEAPNQTYQRHGETNTAQAEAYQPDNSYGYGQGGESYSMGNGQSYSGYAEGWYDEHGQWHGYEQQGTSANTGTFTSYEECFSLLTGPRSPRKQRGV